MVGPLKSIYSWRATLIKYVQWEQDNDNYMTQQDFSATLAVLFHIDMTA